MWLGAVGDVASSCWVVDDVVSSASSQRARLGTDDVAAIFVGGTLNKGVWRACV